VTRSKRAPRRARLSTSPAPPPDARQRLPHFFRQIGQIALVLLRQITEVIPARTAPSTFPDPPIGRTRPRSVTSPVIAISWRAGARQRRDERVAIVRLRRARPSRLKCGASWRSRRQPLSRPLLRASARERRFISTEWARARRYHGFHAEIAEPSGSKPGRQPGAGRDRPVPGPAPDLSASNTTSR